MSRIDHAKLNRQHASRASAGPRPATEVALAKWRRELHAAKKARRAERRRLKRTPATAGNRPESLGPTKRVQGEPKLRGKQSETSTGADSGTGVLAVL